MLTTYIIYNFILIGSTTFLYYSSKCKKNIDKKLLIFFAFLIIATPAAFRYNIGIDYRGYVDIYNSVLIYGTSYAEIGFNKFILLLHSLSLSVEWLFIITSIVIYGITINSFKLPGAILSNFLFITLYYLDSYIFIRSYIVFALSLHAINYVVLDNKKIAYILIIIIGGLFHKSAFLLIPFIFITNSATSLFIKKYNPLILLFIIAIYLFGSDISLFIMNHPIASLFGYDNYIKNPHFARVPTLGSGLGVIYKLFILITPLLFAKNILNAHPKYLLPLLINYAALISLILSLQIFILHRLHTIFYPAYIFVPILLWPLLRSRFRQLIILILILISLGSLVLFERNILTQQSHYCDGGRISPYVSIFNKEDDTSINIPTSKCNL